MASIRTQMALSALYWFISAAVILPLILFLLRKAHPAKIALVVAMGIALSAVAYFFLVNLAGF